MRDLEKVVKKYIDLISVNIFNAESDEEFFLLCKELSGLESIVDYNGLNIIVPKYVKDYIDERSFFSIDFSLNFFKEFEMLYDDFKEFKLDIGETFNRLDDSYLLYERDYPKFEINIDDSIKLVRSFFKSFNKDIYKHFEKVVDDELYIGYLLDGNIIDGFTLSLNSQCANIVEIRKRNDILMASNLVHEVMHSFIESQFYYLRYDERNRKLNNNLDEVITYFSQLVFTNYLKEINFDWDSVQFLINDNTNRWILFSNLINKYMFKTASEVINDGVLDYMLDESVLYGTTMAYHYFDKYLNDFSVFDDLINMSLDCPFKDRNNLISNYGLDSDKLSDYESNEKILLKYGDFVEKR